MHIHVGFHTHEPEPIQAECCVSDLDEALDAVLGQLCTMGASAALVTPCPNGSDGPDSDDGDSGCPCGWCATERRIQAGIAGVISGRLAGELRAAMANGGTPGAVFAIEPPGLPALCLWLGVRADARDDCALPVLQFV